MDFSEILQKSRKKCQKVWLVGGLFYCNKDDLAGALKEVTLATIFSTATFWMSALIFGYLAINKERSWLCLLLSTIKDGELFIFAVGFLGSTTMIVFDDPKGVGNKFPSRLAVGTLLVVLCFVCAASFTIVKLRDVSNIPLNEPLIIKVSIIFAASAVILRFLSIAYRKHTLRRPDETIKQLESEFAERFEARHQGGVQ